MSMRMAADAPRAPADQAASSAEDHLLSTEIYLPGGRRTTWNRDVTQEDVQAVCDENDLDPAAAASLLRVALPAAASPVAAHAVRGLAEELGFVSYRGMAKGFPLILPRGMHFEACLDAFNRRSLAALEAETCEVPDVYDHSVAAIRDLTARYEEQARIFHVGGNAGQASTRWRLAYAADPMLFAWLSGRTLARSALPYTIHTQSRFIRHFQSGELNGLDKVRQFSFPELHTFLPAAQMAERYVWHTRLAASGMDALFGNGWVQRLELEASLVEERPSLVAELAAAVPVPTIVHTVPRKLSYYRMKTMLMADAGYRALMLYNLQWDEVNGRRFGISLDDGQPCAILHGSLAGGISRLLPCLLGQALQGTGPRAIPPALSMPSITLFLVGGVSDAQGVGERLRDEGVSFAVETPAKLGKAIARLKQGWYRYFAVVGPDEVTRAEALVQDTQSSARVPMAQWLEEHRERLRAFRPASAAQRRRGPPIVR